jgi:hypothetical protein
VTDRLRVILELGRKRKVVAGALDSERLHAGALQRAFVGAVLLWLGITGARLLRSSLDPPGGVHETG